VAALSLDLNTVERAGIDETLMFTTKRSMYMVYAVVAVNVILKHSTGAARKNSFEVHWPTYG